MIFIYFERGGYAELIATFTDERMYTKEIYTALEKEAKTYGFDKVTENQS